MTKNYSYYTTLMLGVVIGAFGIGTLNLSYTLHTFMIGKSIMGAIIGGIIAIELYKKIIGISGSTGAYFVPSLAIGIAIGRIGCFLAGLEDYTCGTETSSIFGCDFGDGKMRHPVQLYESIAMWGFFFFIVVLYRVSKDIFEKRGFYYFVAFYAGERFILEFFKPYKGVLFDLNIFQVCSILMITYASYQLYCTKE